MTFDYTGGSVRRRIPPAFGRWIWSENSGARVKWVEYDASIANTKKKTITDATLASGSSIVAVSPAADCIVSFLASTNIDTVKFDNTGAGTTVKVSHWSTVTTAGLTTAQANAAGSTSNFQAGDACWAFRAGNLVYVKPSGAGAYTKSAISASDLATATFDDSLRFALATNKFYKFGATDYANIFNLTGLKTTTKFYSSPDGNRILFFTYNNSQLGQPVAYDCIVKLYVSDGTSYSEIALPNGGLFTTRDSDARIYFDVNFNTIVLGYASGTTAQPTVDIHAMNVDWTAKTITEYTVPDLWFTLNDPNFFIFGNYIYCMQPDGAASIEYFFNIDRTNLEIILMSQRPVDMDEYNTFRGGSLIEDSGIVYAVYDSEPVSGTVRLIKRAVGSPALQGKISNIVAQDAGFLVINGEIRLCSAGCSFCINPTSCTTCSPGFALDSILSTCVRCAPLCATCTTSDLVNCATCIPGYYPVVSGLFTTCTRCHSSCITCHGPSASDCDSCRIGLYLDASSNSCTDCIANCVACTSGAVALCDTCKPGYVYSSTTKTCVKCIAGCAVCNPLQIYTCVNCGSGFEPVLDSNNVITQCKPCPPRCQSCESGVCTECRTGFRLINSNCTEQCRLPCKECTELTATNCTSCLGGYTLDAATGVCNPDLSCNNGATCNECPIGYNLVAKTCRQCNGGANCRTCDNANVDKCASCVRGFYLNEVLACTACNITGCDSCDNPVYCSICRPGFILSGTGSSAQCTKCAAKCQTCFESPNNCDICATGFTKKGWNCVNNINVELNLVLDGNFTLLTTEQYEAVESSLATLMNKDRSDITVTSLRSGSIVVEATVGTTNIAEQTSLISTLQTQLAAGSSIGGFTVEAIGFVANSDAVTIVQDDSEAIRYRNIAIIVGVVIPIGLIIIFIILVILYKKGLICSSANEPARVRDATMDEIQLKDAKSIQ